MYTCLNIYIYIYIYIYMCVYFGKIYKQFLSYTCNRKCTLKLNYYTIK